MKTYKEYLQEQGYATTTIENYNVARCRFIDWCKRNHTTAVEINYDKILKYIKHLQQKDTRKTTVQKRINIIKNYFKYLVYENYRADNPLENINLKGVKRIINYNLLDPDELEDLYYSFDTENYQEEYHKYTSKRNKVIVGLMVYQGLNTTELRQLELENLELYKGKIYIKSGKRSNARLLELKPWQVIELLEYEKEIRTEIVKRKQVQNDRLFVPNNARLSNTILAIIKKLKKTNNKVQNIHQIRASVITNWLGQYNLRKVQYLAGHRYISSTERYLQDDLENLHDIVNNFHPIS